MCPWFVPIRCHLWLHLKVTTGIVLFRGVLSSVLKIHHAIIAPKLSSSLYSLIVASLSVPAEVDLFYIIE